jgi:hypothetical protein
LYTQEAINEKTLIQKLLGECKRRVTELLATIE